MEKTNISVIRGKLLEFLLSSFIESNLFKIEDDGLNRLNNLLKQTFSFKNEAFVIDSKDNRTFVIDYEDENEGIKTIQVTAKRN